MKKRYTSPQIAISEIAGVVMELIYTSGYTDDEARAKEVEFSGEYDSEEDE